MAVPVLAMKPPMQGVQVQSAAVVQAVKQLPASQSAVQAVHNVVEVVPSVPAVKPDVHTVQVASADTKPGVKNWPARQSVLRATHSP